MVISGPIVMDHYSEHNALCASRPHVARLISYIMILQLFIRCWAV